MGFIDKSGRLAVTLEWDHIKEGSDYRALAKEIGPGKAVAVWLNRDLKEIWRAELRLEKLPLAEEKK